MGTSKLSEKNKEKLIWLLILFSPITLGFLIPFAVHGIIICKIDKELGGFENLMLLGLMIVYFFVWSVIFKKLSGRSAWL